MLALLGRMGIVAPASGGLGCRGGREGVFMVGGLGGVFRLSRHLFGEGPIGSFCGSPFKGEAVRAGCGCGTDKGSPSISALLSIASRSEITATVVLARSPRVPLGFKSFSGLLPRKTLSSCDSAVFDQNDFNSDRLEDTLLFVRSETCPSRR